jgi:IclR family transcriptional regulator, acetate operon repressor
LTTNTRADGPVPTKAGGASKRADAERGAVLQSLLRGVSVLDVLATSEVAMSAREVADAAGLDRTVTHRALRTLVMDGLVRRSGLTYAIGDRTLVFRNAYLRHSALRHAALPLQIDMLYRGFIGRPWILSVVQRAGRQMTQVSQIWSPTAPLDSLLGITNFRIEQTAAGRCILAYLDREAVVKIIGEDLAEDLQPRFEAIRAAGGIDFVSPRERADVPIGMSALAALITTRGGVPVAGLTLSGTELEPYLDRDSDVAARLARTAREIGNRLP